MKILAFSDIVKWEGHEEQVDNIRPDVVVLTGDMTSDGFADFLSHSFFECRETTKESLEIRKAD